MRFLKFRVWNDIDKKMIEWPTLKVMPEFLVDVIKGKVKHHKLLPYTGIANKKGEELCLDDVIEWYGDYWRVIWESSAACFAISQLANPHMSETLDELDDFVIAGNFHENKELVYVSGLVDT